MKESMSLEEQVEQIAKALLADLSEQKSKIEFRGLCYQGARVSCQGPGSTASPFDASRIANILKDLGDGYNADLEGPAQEVIEQINEEKGKKFKEKVETLSKTWKIQNPELEYEKAFLVVAVKLFRYLALKACDVAQPWLLTEAVNSAPEVRHYIERPGGWDNLEN